MAKMSEKKDPAKPSLCENFEPQAWRKTVCKNCFQPPEKHVSGGGAAGGTPNDNRNASTGTGKMQKIPQQAAARSNEKEQAQAGSQPMSADREKDTEKARSKSPTRASQKSAAASLKDRYEQLERDKYKPKKEPPKVAPKTKGPGGLKLITDKQVIGDKHDRLTGIASAPVTPEVKLTGISSTPGTPEVKMENQFASHTLPRRGKGRLLDIKVSDQDSDVDVKSGKVVVNKLVKSKFGSVDNVSDSEESSKVEVFNRSRFGSVENISFQPKKKEPIPIPIQKSKFGGSMENVSAGDGRKHSGTVSQNAAADFLNKLDNFSIEIRSGAGSDSPNICPTVINQHESGKVDIITIPIKRTSAPSTPTADTSHKSWSNKESLQNELNEKKLSKGHDVFSKTKDMKSPTPERDQKTTFKLKVVPGKTDSKVELKSPTPERLSKFDSKSPTPETDKTKFEKPEMKHKKFDNKIQDNGKSEKVDLKAGLKKHDTSVNGRSDKDTAESKNHVEFPTLKSLKKDTHTDKSSTDKTDINDSSDKKTLKNDIAVKNESQSAKSTEDRTKEEPKADEVNVTKNKFELPKLTSKDDNKVSVTKEDSNSVDNSTQKANDKNHKDETIDKKSNQIKNHSSVKEHSVTLSKENHEEKLDNKVETKTTSKNDAHENLVNVTKGTEEKLKVGHSEEKQELSKTEIKDETSKKQSSTHEKNGKETQVKTKKEDDKKPAWSKFEKKDEQKEENDKKPDSSIKIGSKSESSDSPLKLAKKGDAKTTLGKPDQKQEEKTTFGKQNKEKNELSKPAKTNDPKSSIHKQDEKKPEPKSKLGNQEDKKPGVLGRLGNKEESKHDAKPGQKTALGKKEGDKPELLSKFNKKNDTVSKLGKQEENKQDQKKNDKPEFLSKFDKKKDASQDSKEKKDKPEETKPWLKPKLGKADEKKDSKDKQMNDSKSSKPETNKPAWKAKLEDKTTGKKEEPNKTKPEPSKPAWKAKLEDKAADKKEEPNKTKPEPSKPSWKAKLDEKSSQKKEEEKGKNEASKPSWKTKLEQKATEKKEETKDDNKKAEPAKPSWKAKLDEKKHEKKDEPATKNKTDKTDQKKEESNNKNVPAWKAKLQEKTVEKKEEPNKPEPSKPGWKSKLEEKSAQKKDETKGKPDIKDVGKKDEPASKPSWKTKLEEKTATKKDDKQTGETKTDQNKPAWKLKLEEKSSAKKEEHGDKSNKILDKLEEKKNDVKSKSTKPELKSVKPDDDVDKKTDVEKASEKPDLVLSKTDDTSKQIDSSVNESNETDKKIPDSGFHLNKVSDNEKSISGPKLDDKSSKDDSDIGPPASLISTNNFDDISTEGEVTLGDEVDACALNAPDDSQPVHVDTQVFTSSRQKTVGVIGPDEIESIAAASRIGLSDLQNSRTLGESDGETKLQNGDISAKLDTDIDKDETPAKIKTKIDTKTEADLEKLKSELKLMMERCSNLEKENEQLRDGLDKKDTEVRDVKKDKHVVEAEIESLQSKVNLMEEKCSNLEADNDNLSGKLKSQIQDQQQSARAQQNKEDHDDKLTANEKYMADVLEENETLKQEINEMKLEIDEMYDSFRDQEAEEFRELQRELEITAKNCRILQFKLRKMERHGGQIEQDKQHVEEKLRMLQNQFHDRDAVSHIHTLEDELRMAKDVSVRLHDELDLMEDKRGKLEEENRHLTELLEQADRKQFRLEMEVDKLRDKIVCLRQEMRAKEDPNGERKVPLAVSGRQDSIERQVQEMKRELYDSREREADMRDQLQYLEGDHKTLTKKVTSLEEDNERLSKQLKKMSIERALARNARTDGNNSPELDRSVTESEVELQIKYELAEKELSTVKRKMMDIEEENEMLHSEMFSIEQKLKEKDRQLEVIPEPSSPKVYYEDKIKEYEKEADEFRSKLLQKQNEIQCLYSQLRSGGEAKRGNVLRKARSLDYEPEHDLLVTLQRQIEMGEQESLILRDKVEVIERESVLKSRELESLKSIHDEQTQECVNLRDQIEALEKEVVVKSQNIESLKSEQKSQEFTGLSALAVAYVDSDNETQLRKQLAEMERSRARLVEHIEHLSTKLTSLARSHNVTKTKANESISNIPIPFVSGQINKGTLDSPLHPRDSNDSDVVTTSESYDSCGAYSNKNIDSSNDQYQSNIFNIDSFDTRVADLNKNRDSSRDHGQSYPFSVVSSVATPNSCNYLTNDTASGRNSETYSPPRDPYILLSVIDEIFCEVLQRACKMDTAVDGNIVPPETEQPGRSNSETELPVLSNSETEQPEWSNSETEQPGQSNSETEQPVRSISETEQSERSKSPEIPNSSEGFVSREDSELKMDNNSVDFESVNTEITCVDNKINVEESTNSDKLDAALDISESSETGVRDLIGESADEHTDTLDVDMERYSQRYGDKSDKDIISYLEEEIDDLRLIIQSKEVKNVCLEEEVRTLQTSVKASQDDSRRREMELLNEMDLIHSRNEILSNLLEIVRERSETAEDELERVLSELHEKDRVLAELHEKFGESSDSSEKTTPLGEISDGSDDVFDGSPADRVASLWEEQFKKRIRSLETLLAEERKKVGYLEKKLELNGSDVISSAMSDDAKLHQREKELLQSELIESQRHAIIANDQIRSLTEKLKKSETEKRQSPVIQRKPQTVSSSSDEYEDAKEKLEPYCRTCSELQSVKDQLCEELYRFKDKADELEGKVDEVNAVWMSKLAACEKEKHLLEQKLKQKFLDCKKVEEQLGKLREEDRMKDIFLKERDTNLKDKMAQIARKDEIIQEQEDIIRQREEDMQQLFDQISQREKNLKELSEKLGIKEESIKEKENRLKQLSSFIDEKNDELHYLEEEMQETNIKRKESETLLAEMKEKLDETFKPGNSELETENERLQSDVENLMTNITQLHNDKVTLENELDKSKQALSEAMLMWDKDRSTLGSELSVVKEKLFMHDITANKKEPQAVQALRKEVHTIVETKEKIALQAMLSKIEHDNTVRLLKADKFKLTEELTSKIRMLTHEMTNNDKMADELSQLRGQDDINYQLHHHEKLLRAEYMAMKVRYETQLGRLQREHIQLLEVVEKMQREKNLDSEIISGIQRGMANIKETYTHDLSRWNGERSVLESHIKQIEEGKEIASHLRAQIDALRQQLSDQDMARTELINKMTSERQGWDIDKATLNSNINQLEEQLAVFVHSQSKSQDTQFRMELAWEKERAEQQRLLAEAHGLAMDLQNQLQRRDEEHTREKKNLLEQLERHRQQYDTEKNSKDKVTLEVTTSETRIKLLEQQLQDVKDKHRKEEDSWFKEKGDLLRRLAELRKTHQQDSRRIEDVLTALKRLRELAAIIMESDNSATLPSNGTDGAAATGDASAASASVISGEEEMGDLKQNIDQIILKYVKESLQQIHLATEELAKPPIEVTREDRQKIRRSLSSSEIELLKDEFLIGPQDIGRVRANGNNNNNNGSPDDHVTTNREQKTFTRTISTDGNGVPSEHLPSDYIENILMEQSTFYKDGKNSNVEVHRIKSKRETTKIETTVTSLPKPPPSFVIPRSRSTSPGPKVVVKTTRTTQPVIHSISVDTTKYPNRLSAPTGTASADSSPVRHYPSFIPSTSGDSGLPRAGSLQSGSLDRLSPTAARKRFFELEQQPVAPGPYTMALPERHKKNLAENRNSKSLSNTELGIGDEDKSYPSDQIRSSVSMDDGVMSSGIETDGENNLGHKQGSKSQSTEHVKHSAFRDMFKTMKKKFKPKVKRSHSAREYDRHGKDKQHVGKTTNSVQELAETEEQLDEKHHVVQERMTPIDIPTDSDEGSPRKSRKDASGKKDRSRSPKTRGEKDKDDTPSSSESTLQRLKKRFRSKSADRSEDRHVTPILVGHSKSGSEKDDSWQYSETCV